MVQLASLFTEFRWVYLAQISLGPWRSPPTATYKTSLKLARGDAVFALVDATADGYGGDATGVSFRISLASQY